jgi:GNAT superfamily N-acetyltransferase
MELLVDTVPADGLPPDLESVLRAVYQREFGWDRLVYAEPRWYVLGMFEGELIGRVGVLSRTISVGGAPVAVGGITGVVTEPDYRGRGVARTLVAHALAFLRDEQHLPLVMLTCNRKLGPLYEKLGWRVVEGPTVYAQPDGPRTCPGLTMVSESGSISWPDGRIDMRGLPW